MSNVSAHKLIMAEDGIVILKMSGFLLFKVKIMRYSCNGWQRREPFG